jgi:hypothetical protein
MHCGRDLQRCPEYNYLVTYTDGGVHIELYIGLRGVLVSQSLRTLTDAVWEQDDEVNLRLKRKEITGY